MKVFINTFGSRGDVQPFIILGKALKEKGHTVMICTGSRFEAEIVKSGLEYGYITNEAFALLDSDSTILEDSLGIIGIIKVSLKLIKVAKPINKKMVQNAWHAAKDFKPDLVIYHQKALGAVSIAEKFNVPAILISLMPMLAPTEEFPVPAMPNLKLGGWYNLLTYKLVLMGYNSYMNGLNDIRTNEMGLKKLPKYTGLTVKYDKSPVPNIHAISPHILNRPKDWPPIYTMSGYLIEEQEERWTPSAALQEFLAAGEPPVFVGFGSMSGSNPERLTNMVIDALTQANVRGILVTGWGGLEAMDLPENIFKIEEAPYAWLFPRMAAVVHHGGAGTTAAGLRAGRPTVICPFMGDQPFWGDQVVRLGVGLKVSSQKRLKTGELADAICKVTTDIEIQEAATVLGKKIQSEDGVANAINTIDKIMTESKKDLL
jgi:sterol 3beta-glucosyltransferase